ncbi:GtrA family protein [Clostridium sp. CM028]|uniref:GtrA family protein n=1 Tax=Clostridium TaxID=1485 RepID=UPI0013EE92CF|nr:MULTISPECIES: GtrA family protein [Clostridium]MBU3093285.1 GtrA family protein [Clostridium sp. CF011]MBW9144250.1 GtrA family protein [Clostridium sp. CM027]MBW9147440.1 GtrA family protein [Clostridium sp. CM028]MBZ9608456.1 GtrA family protein [Clostridium estertheticum]UVE41113.1 GtrA family protein [Clostridium sp. CM027]
MNNKNKTLQSLSQFINYTLVGATNIIIEIIILNILSFTTGITHGKILFVFNIIAFSVYSISSYKLNKKFTFKETPQQKGYLQYASVLFFSMILNSSMLVLLTSRNPLISLLHYHSNIIHLNHLWFNICILIDSTIIGLLGFLINKFFVFNKKKTC